MQPWNGLVLQFGCPAVAHLPDDLSRLQILLPLIHSSLAQRHMTARAHPVAADCLESQRIAGPFHQCPLPMCTQEARCKMSFKIKKIKKHRNNGCTCDHAHMLATIAYHTVLNDR